VQTFFLQIRDLKTHQPLPGVEIGDMGPKIGFDSKDNGYMFIKHLRIPRTNMLAKYAKIDKTGAFKVKGNPRVAYAIMMFIRLYLTWTTGHALGAACVITTRYGLFRK
jgi:acyl-CoA oxidase